MRRRKSGPVDLTRTETPEPVLVPVVLTGPTVCAVTPFDDPLKPASMPCRACGHYQYGGHQHQPCGICILQEQIDVLRAALSATMQIDPIYLTPRPPHQVQFRL